MTPKIRCFEVTTTVETHGQAEKLSRGILQKRLAACVQIIACQSWYHWQGQLEQAEEFKLLLKTSEEVHAELIEYIEKHHPYDTPEMLTLPVIHANASYLAWLISELKH